ncbi:hypothetical protein CR969_00915 [Candidatus Saccharibacteria bacterium]|nr:MAG: hypothetical protein CR969_00915 [Candidatus Saccharibacteria bacterium]
MAKENIPNTPEIKSSPIEERFSYTLQRKLQVLAENNLDTQFWARFIAPSKSNGYILIVADIAGADPTARIALGLNGVAITIEEDDYSEIKTAIEIGQDKAKLIDWRDIADDKDLPSSIRIVANHMDRFIKSDGNEEAMGQEQLDKAYNNVWHFCEVQNNSIIYCLNEVYVTDNYGDVTIRSISDLKEPGGGYLPNDEKIGQSIEIACDEFVFKRAEENGVLKEYMVESSSPDEYTRITPEKQQLIIDVLTDIIKSEQKLQ